jgi:ClpP class serine protease
MKRRDSVLLIFMGLAMVIFLVILFAGLPAGSSDGGFTLTQFGNRVALIEVTGQITSSDWTVRQIRHWADQDNVAAIVMRLDSP